jgi:uncharacterized protein
MTPEPSLDAGEFSTWLAGIEEALRGDHGSDVPCGTCTACCTSSQFIHIAPDETDALAHIPRELTFAAPRLPRGHVLMGYNEHGHCPMLIDNACSIYEHRPRTCRTYDCRVFPAAGLDVDDETKSDIERQVKRWRFRHASANDEARHQAVRAAAAFLRDKAADIAPVTNTQRAVLSVELHKLFLDRVGQLSKPDAQTVRVEITRRRNGSTPPLST